MIILRHTQIQFVFIGGGDKLKYLASQVAKLNLTNCSFFAYQTKENLPFSLTACDVSIVSVDEKMEGLVAPSKLYSALAAGTAIAAICPQHSYIKNLLAEANCGETFSNGDGAGLATYLEELSQNPRLVEKLGKSARAYCLEHYTRKKIAQDYLKLCR